MASEGLIPVNIKSYLQNFVQTPTVEENLWNSDKRVLHDAVLRKYWKTGKSIGELDYGDYDPTGRISDVENTSLLKTIVNSYTDPVFRLESTLGRAHYKIDEAGNVFVMDAYDFAAPKDFVETERARLGLAKLLTEAYKHGGHWGLANLFGNLMSPQGTGNPFTISLGATQRQKSE